MIYKPFNNINLPALGMGAMRLEGTTIDHANDQIMIDFAMANGVNFFDTAYVYGKDGASEKGLSDLLSKYPRESYYLSTKYMLRGGADYKAVFNEQLNRLKTDYLDVYMIHGITDSVCQQYIDNGCIEYFAEQKQKGIIKNFGFSSHACIEMLVKFLDYHTWDFTMIQLNYYDWLYGQAKQEYETLMKYNMPVMVMEPIRGGKLASLSPEAEAILKEARPDWSVASWFLRWIKRFPEVQTVLSGMKEVEHLKENIKIFSSDDKLNKLNEEEEQLLFKACEKFREESSVLCTSCLYCIDDCPSEINIPKMIELYNFCKTDKSWDVKKKIEDMDSKGKPCDCTSCGVCLSRCPQKIDVMSIIKELSEK